jgi:hypothetical protein
MGVQHFKQTKVYQKAFSLAMDIFEVTKHFPGEEKYSLTDQIRRSSRSVCASLAEAYRKKRYPAHLFQNFQMPIWKIPKPVYGSILHLPVHTSLPKNTANLWNNVTKREGFLAT